MSGNDQLVNKPVTSPIRELTFSMTAVLASSHFRLRVALTSSILPDTADLILSTSLGNVVPHSPDSQPVNSSHFPLTIARKPSHFDATAGVTFSALPGISLLQKLSQSPPSQVVNSSHFPATMVLNSSSLVDTA